MIHCPVYYGLIRKFLNELFDEIIPKVEKKRAYLENSGIATIWPDYDHSVTVWDRLFAIGFKGILDESENARERLAQNSELTEEQTAFFDGIKVTYEAVIQFIGRLAELAAQDP